MEVNTHDSVLSHSLPEVKTIFFSFKKNRKENTCQNNLKTRRGKHRNVFARRGEGHQTGAALVRGEMIKRSLENGEADDTMDLGKFFGVARLTMDSHVHSRLLGKERRWT